MVDDFDVYSTSKADSPKWYMVDDFDVYSTSKVDSPKWYMVDVLCL